MRACRLQRQFKPKSREEPGNLGEAEFPGAPVFERVERRAADACLTRKRGLTQFQGFAAICSPRRTKSFICLIY